MALDHKQAAQEILDAVGGAGNVVSAAHCATRLRLVIADDSKVNQAAVDNATGAKGNFKASGQLQVIYGTGTVNKVYDEFIALGHITAATKAEAKEAAAENQNPFMRAIKLLGDIFVPIIPAIVASGLLLGIMSALSFMNTNGYLSIDTESSIYVVADLVSGTAFTFLQILIGYSAAKAFGANPYLGAVVGGILINPNLQSAYTMASEGVEKTLSIFGLYSIDLVGYQGHVIPIVIACWILSVLEKNLHKHVPDMFDLFVTPLVSVFVTAFVTIAAVGPIFVYLENAILNGIQFMLTLPFGIGSAIVGGLYAPTVVTGLHQMYTAIDLGQLAQYGLTYWLPIASAANIGQGGACLAVALKTRDKKIKGLAAPSALSAFMGITEPAIFGVNLRFFKPFVAGCVGAAVGAWICAMTSLGATGTGVTGIFGILLCLNQPVQYIIMFVVTAAVAFVLSFILYKDPEAAAEDAAPVAEVEAASEAVSAETIAAPIAGQAVALSEVKDPVFASGAMGAGAAVIPADGKLVAPVSGTVTVLAETGHAVAIKSDNGAEVLMHVGIDTVKLEGKPFAPHVALGDHVSAGQPLMDVDLAQIEAAGLDTATMVIVTNTDAYEAVEAHTGAAIKAGDALVDVR